MLISPLNGAALGRCACCGVSMRHRPSSKASVGSACPVAALPSITDIGRGHPSIHPCMLPVPCIMLVGHLACCPVTLTIPALHLGVGWGRRCCRCCCCRCRVLSLCCHLPPCLYLYLYLYRPRQRGVCSPDGACGNVSSSVLPRAALGLVGLCIKTLALRLPDFLGQHYGAWQHLGDVWLPARDTACLACQMRVHAQKVRIHLGPCS
jgi:hypothetical protein